MAENVAEIEAVAHAGGEDPRIERSVTNDTEAPERGIVVPGDRSMTFCAPSGLSPMPVSKKLHARADIRLPGARAENASSVGIVVTVVARSKRRSTSRADKYSSHILAGIAWGPPGSLF